MALLRLRYYLEVNIKFREVVWAREINLVSIRIEWYLNPSDWARPSRR